MTAYTKDDPKYREFDDADLSHWPSVASKKARSEIGSLARTHGLSFAQNPGGGEFYLRTQDWRCQISMCDDVMDLNTLRQALAEKENPIG